MTKGCEHDEQSISKLELPREETLQEETLQEETLQEARPLQEALLQGIITNYEKRRLYEKQQQRKVLCAGLSFDPLDFAHRFNLIS